MKQKLVLAMGLALAGFASSALAITDEEGNAAVQFNFSNPGARSLGMGGAFLGLADDATAAYTNPAGLTQLSQFEMSAEVRHNGFDSEFLSGGSFTATPFNTSALEYDTASDSTSGLSFLAAVWPHENWAISVYRQEQLNYQNAFSTDGPIESGARFLLSFDSAIDLKTVNYGASAAFKLGDQFSFGLSAIFSDFEIDSVARRFIGGPGVRELAFATGQNGDDTDITFNLGMRWNPSDKFSLGAVYRQGGDFEYDANLVRADATGFTKQTDFHIPDVFGVGAAFRASENFTINLDVNRVFYSNLSDDIVSGFGLDDSVPATAASVAPLRVDDGTEIRLGGEYVFLNGNTPFSLRAGVWRDPEHTLRFNGVPSDLTNGNAVSNAILFSTGDDEIHYALGIGWAFEKFQLDAAADISDLVDTYSISGVLRF